MLRVTIPEREFFDDETQEFITIKSVTLQLEHSLVSLSKWESRWHKPFLGKEEKTYEETIDYIKHMTISQNVKPETFDNLPSDTIEQITDYIYAPMTATRFNEQQNAKKNRDVITAEIIYYWMIVHNIPMECQKWHLNRLLTLIRVCNIKNRPSKKMGKKEILSNNRAMNEARRKKLNTKG